MTPMTTTTTAINLRKGVPILGVFRVRVERFFSRNFSKDPGLL